MELRAGEKGLQHLKDRMVNKEQEKTRVTKVIEHECKEHFHGSGVCFNKTIKIQKTGENLRIILDPKEAKVYYGHCNVCHRKLRKQDGNISLC